MRLLALVLLMSVIAGCTVVNEELNFDPAEPLRVAVLPFQRIDTKGAVVQDEGRLILDNIPLVSRKQEESPVQIVRRFVLAELEKTNLDVIAPILIDLDLPHHGFSLPDGSLDLAKLMQTSPAELCTKFLNCDAVLYGMVTKWDRAYYGLQSINTVGIHLKLISATDNKVLYESRIEDSESRGITKGPTGFSALVVEPVRGLDSDIIVELARNVAQRAISPLMTKNRTVSEPPPSIYAATHDGAQAEISPRRPLVVVLFGTAGQTASFSIGKEISVPMIERSPGHYYGEWYPLRGIHFAGQDVTAVLEDRFGRRTEQPIAGKTLLDKH